MRESAKKRQEKFRRREAEEKKKTSICINDVDFDDENIKYDRHSAENADFFSHLFNYNIQTIYYFAG